MRPRCSPSTRGACCDKIRASGVVAPDQSHRESSLRMPQEQNTMRVRLWHSKTPPPPTTCPRCGTVFVKNSPRQKFCTIKCQAEESASRRPPRVWGTPEYYKRKELEDRGFRRCKDCKDVFPLIEYWSVGKSKSGKEIKCSRCKKCAATHQQIDRKVYKYPEAKRKYSREYREKFPDLVKQRIKNWATHNKEALRQVARRRRIRKSKNGLFLVTERDLIRHGTDREEPVTYVTKRLRVNVTLIISIQLFAEDDMQSVI